MNDDDYEIVKQALLFTAQEARQGGMPDVADQYLRVLERLRSGDLDLVPHRSNGVR